MRQSHACSSSREERWAGRAVDGRTLQAAAVLQATYIRCLMQRLNTLLECPVRLYERGRAFCAFLLFFSDTAESG